eukprot:365638-Chlamydomonas_euryale.AAC.5
MLCFLGEGIAAACTRGPEHNNPLVPWRRCQRGPPEAVAPLRRGPLMDRRVPFSLHPFDFLHPGERFVGNRLSCPISTMQECSVGCMLAHTPPCWPVTSYRDAPRLGRGVRKARA